MSRYEITAHIMVEADTEQEALDVADALCDSANKDPDGPRIYTEGREGVYIED